MKKWILFMPALLIARHAWAMDVPEPASAEQAVAMAVEIFAARTDEIQEALSSTGDEIQNLVSQLGVLQQQGKGQGTPEFDALAQQVEGMQAVSQAFLRRLASCYAGLHLLKYSQLANCPGPVQVPPAPAEAQDAVDGTVLILTSIADKILEDIRLVESAADKEPLRDQLLDVWSGMLPLQLWQIAQQVANTLNPPTTIPLFQLMLNQYNSILQAINAALQETPDQEEVLNSLSEQVQARIAAVQFAIAQLQGTVPRVKVATGQVPVVSPGIPQEGVGAQEMFFEEPVAPEEGLFEEPATGQESMGEGDYMTQV